MSDGQCPLCNRDEVPLSDHHLVPKCRGGVDTLPICCDCHSAIHAQFSNKELEGTFNTVESLLANEKFASTVKFISKQSGRVKTHVSRAQRRRGRNG
jgi:hypothetical protein